MDHNNSRNITAAELFDMFQGMGIKDLTEQQANAIHASMDFDGNGDGSLPEFQANFHKVVNSRIEDLLFEIKQ